MTKLLMYDNLIINYFSTSSSACRFELFLGSFFVVALKAVHKVGFDKDFVPVIGGIGWDGPEKVSDKRFL